VIAVLSWLGAKVSGHVKSQARHLPFDHGVSDKPSNIVYHRAGLATSSQDATVHRPTSTDISTRLIKSFTALCRDCLPEDLRQLSPCHSLLSTAIPLSQHEVDIPERRVVGLR